MSGNTSSQCRVPLLSIQPRVLRSGRVWRRPDSDIHARGRMTVPPWGCLRANADRGTEGREHGVDIALDRGREALRVTGERAIGQHVAADTDIFRRALGLVEHGDQRSHRRCRRLCEDVASLSSE